MGSVSSLGTSLVGDPASAAAQPPQPWGVRGRWPNARAVHDGFVAYGAEGVSLKEIK